VAGVALFIRREADLVMERSEVFAFWIMEVVDPWLHRRMAGKTSCLLYSKNSEIEKGKQKERKNPKAQQMQPQRVWFRLTTPEPHARQDDADEDEGGEDQAESYPPLKRRSPAKRLAFGPAKSDKRTF
jgi:hypothetical protein